jgi:REP element-mobilizing transposase RayT
MQVAGGHYHVTARGTAKAAIFTTDEDRLRFLLVLGEVVEQFGWRLYAYCLMENHYHLALMTPEANLGAGMSRLNQLYAQWFNHRHDRVGHLFQERYWSQLIENESYVLAVVRYIAANPVRAGLCDRPRDWPWSSARATAGLDPVPKFLDVAWVLRTFAADTGEAAALYEAMVEGGDSPRLSAYLVPKRRSPASPRPGRM